MLTKIVMRLVADMEVILFVYLCINHQTDRSMGLYSIRTTTPSVWNSRVPMILKRGMQASWNTLSSILRTILVEVSQTLHCFLIVKQKQDLHQLKEDCVTVAIKVSLDYFVIVSNLFLIQNGLLFYNILFSNNSNQK